MVVMLQEWLANQAPASRVNEDTCRLNRRLLRDGEALMLRLERFSPGQRCEHSNSPAVPSERN